MSTAAPAVAITNAALSLEPDEWLGPLLGKPAYRVSLAPAPREELAARFKAALVDGPAFFYARIAPSDVPELQWLEGQGFRLVDTTISFTRSADATFTDGTATARFAVNNDEDSIGRVARECLTGSRFHLDPKISRDTANSIKEAWARNFFRGGRGRWMVVAELEGRVAGFLQLLHYDRSLVVDLIAVDESARQRGFARAMVAFAAAECSPIDEIVVGTQLSNATSIQFYQSVGFHVASAHHVLHLHV